MSFLRRMLAREPSKAKDERIALSWSACPHCGAVIDPAPTTTRKCPHCRERIIVRTRRSDGVKLLLTEGDAAEFDTNRAAEAARNNANP